MAAVAIERVFKSFGPFEVIHGVDVDIGDEEFVDGVNLTGAQFYDRLKHTDQIARTAAPSPGAGTRPRRTTARRPCT